MTSNPAVPRLTTCCGSIGAAAAEEASIGTDTTGGATTTGVSGVGSLTAGTSGVGWLTTGTSGVGTLAATIVVRENINTADLAQPLVIPPSQYFEGIDGPWSTFNLRVGTPEQDVRVTISTASPETLVVLSEYGCSTKLFGTVPAGCASSRGMMFSPNTSSTWIDNGFFGINQDGVGLEANLGYSQAANFGTDTVGLGLVAGANGVTLKNQTVGGIASTSPFYLGIFGLGTQPANLSSLELKQVYGQLIFGGYDTSRFTSNSVSFTLAQDVTRDIVVSLQSISYSGTAQTSLLASPILIFIDSTDPNLWLPETACQQFETAFGLTLDGTTGLYLINDSHHQTVLTENAQVRFRLSDTPTGGEAVTIVLPYSAFDLQAEYPMVTNSSRYFPLKRAANETQYTLGRTFLQEAYLTVDYERGNFSVSSCSWVEGAAANVVTITSKGSAVGNSGTTGSPESTKSGLSTGAIAGISVAAAVIVLALAIGGFFLLKRQRQKQASIQTITSVDPNDDDAIIADSKSIQSHQLSNFGEVPKHELNDTQIYQMHAGDEPSHELNDTQIYQIQDAGGVVNQESRGHVAYELTGSEVHRVELDGAEKSKPTSP
ncbi:hypothetical protein VE02_02393 [Pseudogymnoascus sp. 03VT05]|nr:hypothetical protein VE02_02393 [Pseudogymnoascus sp. 03VT05]